MQTTLARLVALGWNRIGKMWDMILLLKNPVYLTGYVYLQPTLIQFQSNLMYGKAVLTLGCADQGKVGEKPPNMKTLT